ncbi:MAG TPA: crossover junction endodeoxyribonuclease RuvC [Steroidobacteraceae bacterium]|nr:crossover junction endodeoxyribonuclease RuvC [Steroidobacteraceae bacterium]
MARNSSRSWRSYRPEAVPAAPDAPGGSVCRVLGLDPGSIRTGYGLIECVAGRERHLASGVIRTSGASFAQRLRSIYDALSVLVAEFRPDEIAIERVFVHRNPDSALKLGQARGAALCAAVSLGAVVHEFAPRAIKLAVSGYGGAEKGQVASMITTLLSLPKAPPADAADALAVALCHAQGRRMALLLAGATRTAPRAAARRAVVRA